MTRRSPTWAAVRYRGSQSVALVLVSALVTTCAVFAPLFVRTLEQGLLRAALVERDVADTTVVVRASRTASDSAVGPADLVGVLPAEAGRWFGDPVGMLTADTSVQPQDGLQRSPLRLVARDAVCDHVEVTSGRCPEEAGEVLVSAADAEAWGWEEGRRFAVPDPSAAGSGGQRGRPGDVDARRRLPEPAGPRLLAAHDCRRQVGLPHRAGRLDRPGGRRLPHGAGHLRRGLGRGGGIRRVPPRA